MVASSLAGFELPDGRLLAKRHGSLRSSSAAGLGVQREYEPSENFLPFVSVIVSLHACLQREPREGVVLHDDEKACIPAILLAWLVFAYKPVCMFLSAEPSFLVRQNPFLHLTMCLGRSPKAWPRQPEQQNPDNSLYPAAQTPSRPDDTMRDRLPELPRSR